MEDFVSILWILLALVLLASPIIIASLISRITGRPINLRTRTGTIKVQPFQTKKEREKADKNDETVKELNNFCSEVELMRPKQEFTFGDMDIKYEGIGRHSYSSIGLELYNENGRPMLTQNAIKLLNTGNASKVVIQYRELKRLYENKTITFEEYSKSIVELYDDSFMK